MFAWNDKYKLIFSDLGASDKVGVNDVGIGVFKRKPYIGLTIPSTYNGYFSTFYRLKSTI